MIKVAILCPYPTGKAPSQRFRFEQYLGFLQSHDIHVKVFPFLTIKGWEVYYQTNHTFYKIIHILYGLFKRWLLLFRVPSFDYIFIHREAAPFGPPVFEWIIAKILRKKIIYDLDDAIWLPNYSKQHQNIHRIKAYWKVNFILRWSEAISAGNQYIANYAKQFNDKVIVVPTTIDLMYHHGILKKAVTAPFVIGWTGTHTTVCYLKPLIPILEQLSNIMPFEFHVISNEVPDFTLPNLVFIPWNKESEIRDILNFDLGLMPLTDDEWSKGKCGFKALQYMSLKIPTIASNVGTNAEIIEHARNGFLVDDIEDWIQWLQLLMEDVNLRKDIGEQGKLTVQERYSIIANQQLYLNLFKT